MEMKIDIKKNRDLDYITLQKMSFIYNALETGWTIKKNEDKFVFSKKHEGKREVYLEEYLQKFIESNLTAHKANTDTDYFK
jgi:hypothetical protein